MHLLISTFLSIRNEIVLRKKTKILTSGTAKTTPAISVVAVFPPRTTSPVVAVFIAVALSARWIIGYQNENSFQGYLKFYLDLFRRIFKRK